MKGTVLAIETSRTLRRAAVMRDGVLDALEIDRLEDRQPATGALYCARITGLIPGIGAATADLGHGIAGFFPDGAGLIPGQSLLVEIRREAEGDKAARLSPAIQLRSEHLVFTPARPGINISRKITEEAERTRLRAALDPFATKGGFVIRTEACTQADEAIRAQGLALVEKYTHLCADPAPGLRLAAPDAVARLLDRAGPGAAVIADEASLDALPSGLSARHDPAPFETLDIDTALDTLMLPRHDLAEGWLSIDPTPALVAIDVNTGGAGGGKTALRVNLDAARTIPRLLSLKKLGGLILVDFAALPKGRDRARIADAFHDAATRYLAEARVMGWGPAGLLESVCRRPGRSLAMLMPEDAR